jgi:signal transduction histidine kinase
VAGVLVPAPGLTDARADLLADVALVVSELVTNAVQAGCEVVTVLVDVHRDRVRLTVHDDAPGLPRQVSSTVSDAGGRGLLLIDALSAAWDVVLDPPGKNVWAELAIPAELTATLDCRGAEPEPSPYLGRTWPATNGHEPSTLDAATD